MGQLPINQSMGLLREAAKEPVVAQEELLRSTAQELFCRKDLATFSASGCPEQADIPSKVLTQGS